MKQEIDGQIGATSAVVQTLHQSTEFWMSCDLFCLHRHVVRKSSSQMNEPQGRRVSDLQYPDIYNYLVNFPSSYFGESLKGYKSLEGFK